MAPKNAILDRARKQIEQQLKQAEDDRRKVLIKKRLEFITNGINAVAQKKYAEAVVNFQSYIKLLEEWKGVAEGTLAPNHFDYTKEMGDLLMLSGLYWDLAKIFDRTESQEKLRLFHHYLEKFILFSKGTHWAPMCTPQASARL
jgi:cell division protein YceG involved in septum cleavage